MKNKYKKFNISIIAIVTILLLTFVAINAFIYKDYGASLWLESIYNKKIEYAHSIKTQKIIIVGGSNVLFSIDTRKLERKLGIPVVNTGTNAGLGLPYLLYRIKKDFAKPGDTVLLSIEESLFNGKKDASEELFKYVRSYDKEYFKKLSLKDKLKGYSRVNFNNFLNFLIMDQKIKKEGIKAVADVTYNPENLNDNGDQTKNDGHKTVDFDKKNIIIKQLKDKLDFENYSMVKLVEFLDWCDGNNIKVIYHFPTIPFHEEYSNEEYSIQRNELKQFFKSRNILVLDTSDVYYLDDQMFYDTGYHLNNDGRFIRTNAILRELKKVLNINE